VSLVQRITMTDAKVKFGNLSLNNQYQVHFAGFNSSIQNYIRNNLGILNADDFISREMGILCFDASLPATALATAEVKDNFMGVPQEFAHDRYVVNRRRRQPSLLSFGLNLFNSFRSDERKPDKSISTDLK
jgi:hypothetical protein